MAKLIFRYGTMKSGKSAEAIQIIQNYVYGNKHGCIIVPKINTEELGKIKTRFAGGVEVDASVFEKHTNLYSYIEQRLKSHRINYILVDEANFLTKEQVDQLADIVDYLNITVLAYGLMSKYDTSMFEGAKRLVECADLIEKITCHSICSCGKKANFNARIRDGKIVADKERTVCIDNKSGGINAYSYLPICRKCYKDRIRKEH